MNQADVDEMKKETDRRANDPQPGHYWSEMCCPVCIVVHRLPNHVIICKKTKEFEDGQTWDLEKLEMLSLAEFKDWLSYGSIPGYWADSRHTHDWVIEAANINGETHQK